MIGKAIFVIVLSTFILPAHADGISEKAINHLSTPELATKSFADLSKNFPDRDLQVVPTDTGYALFISQFGAPMVEAAAGICQGRRIEFEYNWGSDNIAHADRIDVVDTYAVVGPIPDEQGPQDHNATIARCAKIKSFDHVFTAESNSDAIEGMHLLNELKRLAASSDDFSLSCTGYDCSKARVALASIDMKNISEVQGCGESWFQTGFKHLCEAIMLSDDSQKAENGPDVLFVRIRRDDGKISVVVKRDHTMKPL